MFLTTLLSVVHCFFFPGADNYRITVGCGYYQLCVSGNFIFLYKAIFFVMEIFSTFSIKCLISAAWIRLQFPFYWVQFSSLSKVHNHTITLECHHLINFKLMSFLVFYFKLFIIKTQMCWNLLTLPIKFLLCSCATTP